MSKILNWVFGSFFRTFGRVLAILVLGGVAYGLLSSKINFDDLDFSFFPLVVHAEDLPYGWADTLPSLSRSRYFDCTGANTCNYVDNTSITLNNNYNQIHVTQQNSNGLTLGSNGIAIQTTDGSSMRSGYLYNAKLYLCWNKSLGNYSSELYPAIYNEPATKKTSYLFSTAQGLSIKPYADNNSYYDGCRLFTSIFVPSQDDVNWVTLRLKRNSGSVSDVYFTLISFELEELGLYSNEVKNALSSVISSSGLATASSINSLNNSISNVQQSVTDLNNAQQDTNDLLSDSSVSDATSSASSFFTNFSTNTHGLTGIITAPLNAIQSLTSQTCSPLVLPLPYVNTNLTLPCMRPIYLSNFGTFMAIYDIVTLGIVSYWVLVRIFALVKDFKNPEHDEIEVVDL